MIYRAPIASAILTIIIASVLPGCVARAGLQGASASNEPEPLAADDHESRPAPREAGDAAFPPGDWSLAERSSWKRIHAAAGQMLNLMNSSCGSDISISYDHEAFRDRLAATDKNHSEDWSVSAMLAAIRNVCLEGEDARATVAGSIDAVHFVRAPGEHGLDDGTVIIVLDLEANPRAHTNDFAAWLRAAL